MYKFLARNGQLLAFGFGILVSAIFLIPVLSGLDAFTALPEDQRGTTNIFTPGLGVSTFLIIAGFVLMLLFGIYQIATNFKNSIVGIGGFAAILVIFLIGRGMGADNTPIQATLDTFEITESASGIIDGGIRVLFAMLIIAGLAFVISEVRNFFK
ncbi:MAG: hypothetical protein AAGG75_15380 [Bacteroidota bacterium]